MRKKVNTTNSKYFFVIERQRIHNGKNYNSILSMENELFCFLFAVTHSCGHGTDLQDVMGTR